MFRRIVLIVVLFFMAAGHDAQAWDIKDYTIAIQMEKDSSIDVTETIEADFTHESKHGIFRDIPTVYDDEQGRRYNVRFEVTGVTDQTNYTWPYREEDMGNFKRIKIGNPAKTVSGRQTYVISYHVTGVVLFFDGYDELYWNAVGAQWDVPIRHVRVSVHLPQPVPNESLKIAAYTGFAGSRTSNARTEFVGEDTIAFEGEDYAPHESFTIDIAVPKGLLTKPAEPTYVVPALPSPQPASGSDRSQGQLNIYEDFSPGATVMVLPAIVFLIVWGIWREFGKDPVVNKSVVVEYKAPDDLRPGEIGSLIDRTLDPRDITATIIDLAIRGYIRIVQNKDYTLVKLKPFDSDGALKPFERKVLQYVFENSLNASEVKMSELRYRFWPRVYLIEAALKEDPGFKKYLGGERNGVVATYLTIGGVVLFAGFMMCVFDLWLMTALLLSGITIILFGYIMPKRTIEGVKIMARIQGFKEFLQRTEKDKIQKAEQQDIFERMLPYAICLGMSTTWAKKFDGLYAQPPQWFTGDYGSVFLYDRFIHDLDRSINAMGSALYAQPQSVSSSGGFSGGGFSGGGSSGGGFGGGGGGSW